MTISLRRPTHLGGGKRLFSAAGGTPQIAGLEIQCGGKSEGSRQQRFRVNLAKSCNRFVKSGRSFRVPEHEGAQSFQRRRKWSLTAFADFCSNRCKFSGALACALGIATFQLNQREPLQAFTYRPVIVFSFGEREGILK